MNNINTEEKDIEDNNNTDLQLTEENQTLIEPSSEIQEHIDTNMPEISQSPVQEINEILEQTHTQEHTQEQPQEQSQEQPQEQSLVQPLVQTPVQTPKLVLTPLPPVQTPRLVLKPLPKQAQAQEHNKIEQEQNNYTSSNKNNIVNAPKDDNYNILKNCKIYNISDSTIEFEKTYKTKNFTDKLEYLMELTEKNFEYLQRNIENLRIEYDHRFDYFKNIKSTKIAGSDEFIFEKEFKLQKNMIQNDLIYIVQSRDIIFLEFYQDLYSIIESLISLEIGIDNKSTKNYNNYKNELLKDVKKNVNMDTEIILELNKLKDILINLIKNIEKSIIDLEKFYTSVNKSLNKGVDITSYCISLETTIKKINLELDSNKKQAIYQMEDDLVKIHGINAKIDFILDISELSIRKNKKTL